MKKRFLAVLMAMCLVLTLLPASALAAGDDPPTSAYDYDRDGDGTVDSWDISEKRDGSVIAYLLEGEVFEDT